MSDNALIRALMSFGQGASNAVASNVSAPVDGLAWLLRKGGLPIPQNPVGGSDWMAQQGLTAVPQNRIAGLLGETAGMVGPAVVQAAAPKIAGGLLALDDKAMDMARQGIERRMVSSGMIQPATVWHGSPHKFDKFDSSKIGTGEGAQAYGHGLYFAENPAVAEDYKKALSTVVKVDGRPVLANNQSYKTGNPIIDDNLIAANGDLRAAIKDQLQATRDARQVGRQNGRIDGVKEFQRELADLRALRGRVETTTDGALYKVDLPDNAIARMLDWDKPLSQQAPEVQEALKKSGLLKADGSLSFMYNETPRAGSDMYERITSPLAKKIRGEDDASTFLRKQGIPGIRYLDGGSRGAGQGSSNFVVFPGQEDILKILERNGVPIK